MIFSSPANRIIDIHSHIIPYVDDGASDMEEACRLLSEEYKQGVRYIVTTTHLRYGMFDTDIVKVYEHFCELQEWLYQSEMSDLELFMSREYYCDARLEKIMDGYIRNLETVVFDEKLYYTDDEIRPFGDSKCILLEFSSNRVQSKEFDLFVDKALEAGLTPIIAHAERYPAVQRRIVDLNKLRSMGAYVQVNADAIIGKDDKRISLTARKLVDEGIAEIVASDCHDLRFRHPSLNKCYSFLKSNYDDSVAKALLKNNAEKLLFSFQK